jgi:hypothetical protein
MASVVRAMELVVWANSHPTMSTISKFSPRPNTNPQSSFCASSKPSPTATRFGFPCGCCPRAKKANSEATGNGSAVAKTTPSAL